MNIYSSLTNLFGMGTMNPDIYKTVRGRSVIDLVREDLNRLSTINMSGSDRLKLTRWTELLHYVGGVVSGGAQCNMTTATTLGLNGSLTGSDITRTSNIMMDL